MKQTTPLVKGLITGAALAVLAFALAYSKSGDSALGYLSYLIYAGGITWALIAYSRSPEYQGKFGAIFNQGFRCFIVVTLVMVIFTGIFARANPQMAQEAAGYYKEDLVKNEKNKTPAEIDKAVEDYKKQFNTNLVYGSILGYLGMGVIFTAAGSGILLMSRK